MRGRIIASLGIVLAVCGPATLGTDGPLPAHPNGIKYPPLGYRLPPASEFREVLSNGMVAFIAEDRMLPTFDLTILLRTGSAVEPRNLAGLAALTGEQMRDGGTAELTPEEFDERVEFLAASIRAEISETRGRVSLSCLSKDIDEGLDLLMRMLKFPRFDDERLRLAKERMIQNFKRRNDSTASVANIEWGFFMNGRTHFSNSYPSSKTIDAIEKSDIFTFHGRYIHPGNMIVAVAGDFDRGQMIAKLEATFGSWSTGETGPTRFPKPDYTPRPGVYVIHKEDVNQGRVSIGHKAIMRGTPDEFPLRVMNGILGASGFRSRLVAKVRSDEGLAYNTGSRFGQGVYYPGDFQCWFQSKSNSCAYAARIVLDEIKRLREERVSQADVDDAVAYYVESFPQRFPTRLALLEAYADDEYTGRDPSYWHTYTDNLKRVTPADVQRVARKHLLPERLVILAVGDAEAIIAGGHDKAPDLGLAAFGRVQRLRLRDPDTLKR